jgi:hypothetical protein
MFCLPQKHQNTAHERCSGFSETFPLMSHAAAPRMTTLHSHKNTGSFVQTSYGCVFVQKSMRTLPHRLPLRGLMLTTP